MAKRHEESSEDNGRTGYGTLKWANIYLDKAQKEAAQLFVKDEDTLWSYLATFIEDGYSVSVSYNAQSQSFIVTGMGKTCTEDNLGWGTTTHGPSIVVCLSRLLYKHFILCAECSWGDAAAMFTKPEP